jgi:hypothetical protein
MVKNKPNNIFGKNKLPNHTNIIKEYVTRFCASEKSIPENAININLIYGRTWEFGLQELFNNRTNLPFGFSYKIEKKYNIHPKRIIEFDINFDLKNYDMMKDYNSFINYYYDEEFSKYNEYEIVKKPTFRNHNIILDGYDTDDSVKIIKTYYRKIKKN